MENADDVEVLENSHQIQNRYKTTTVFFLIVSLFDIIFNLDTRSGIETRKPVPIIMKV